MEARTPSAVRCAFTDQARSDQACGRTPFRRSYQRGAVAVMSALTIVAMVGFCGLALDLALVYNRQAELRNVSDAAALAAARRLNGTAAGVNAAVAAAEAMAFAQQFQYGSSTISWSASAVTFSTSSDRYGTWVDAATAAASPDRIMFAQVDTSQLTDAGTVQTMFMPVVDAATASVATSTTSIAGRTMVDAMPLAICAMATTPGVSRQNSPSVVELVEYGFRRGVSYDLMRLNSEAMTPANFVVNPLAAPGQIGTPSDLLPENVGPYVCNGTLGIPRLGGDTISVSAGFPLGSLYKQLNSRFDQYEDNLCNFHAAPPDANIQSYVYTSMPSIFPWMNVAPSGQSAAESIYGGKLQTVADLAPPGGPAANYGPVWAYAKAVQFSAYAPGVSEPAAGYATFSTTAWSTLYNGQTAKISYPSTTPYKASVGINFAAPSTTHRPGARGRRVLNVPLLSCSTLSGSAATVLAVGKFFMTVPATSTKLYAEFAGAIPLQNVQAHVELFQ